MNDLQRFLAVCNGEKPDYIPTFGLLGAMGISCGGLREVYDALLATGMPDVENKREIKGDYNDLNAWQEYWGVDSPDMVGFGGAKKGGRGIRSEKYIKDGFEYIEYETGALIRQFVDNDLLYMIPEYISFHVKDRNDFEKYKELCSPSDPLTKEELREAAEPYRNRTRPLAMWALSSWGHMRSEILGPVAACTVFYDDPELCRDIFDWFAYNVREFVIPVIEAVKPDIVLTSEDICYKNGLIISPEHFNEYCAPIYAEIGEAVKRAGVAMYAIDCDGFVEPLLPLLVPHGVNALYPWEMKAGNDLHRVREKYPEFIFVGGFEKEALNRGNESMIVPEIESKAGLLRGGRFFPGIDHGTQPMITFDNLRKFLTLLHEVTGNPKGNFPRWEN